MRLLLLLLVAGPALFGEFLEVKVRFDDGGCLSCAEGLKERLGRVRGVESVELDLDEGVVELKLAEGNQVRLLPLLSRVEQGGAKMLGARVVGRGTVSRDGESATFTPDGLDRAYRLEGKAVDAGEGVRLKATVADVETGVLRVE